MNDEYHIDLLKKGDKKALYALYDKYSGALYGVVLRICNDKEQAEDLLQDVFVTIWRKIEQYDAAKGRFYTWAYRIAKNTALNSRRKSAPLIQNEDLSVYENSGLTDSEVDYTQLNGAVKKLEIHHQKALDLVFYKGYTHREAHKIMGVPLGTFKSYIRQALLQLREQYQRPLTILWICIEVFGHG
jgi:RNA polymerase sigma-70 factor (ECF subfamily)